MKFRSFTSAIILVFLTALPAFVLALAALIQWHEHTPFSLTWLTGGFALYFLIMFFLWINTFYQIKAGELLIRDFGLLHKKVMIDQIVDIELLDHQPATATHPRQNISGLALRTNPDTSVFVSPLKEQAFLKELQRVNPNILIRSQTHPQKR